ncbi:MAG: transposase, partial [Spirochaetes bacterium]|nr:transposase [Spirochaetota bacterium]
YPNDDKAREGLCQYIARHPVSLQKISYDPVKKKVLYHTKYNDYFKENVKLFTADDFIADLTIHISPKGKHLIRYYGLYASRTKWKTKQDGRFEKFGLKKEPGVDNKQSDPPDYQETSDKASRQAWARLINKIYEVNPLIFPHCGSDMKVIAIIQNRDEIAKIIKHLENKRAPPALAGNAS